MNDQYTLIEDFLQSNKKSFLVLSAGRKEYDRLEFQFSKKESSGLLRFLSSTGEDEKAVALEESLHDKGQKIFMYTRSRQRVSSTIYTCENDDQLFKSYHSRGDTISWSLHKLQREINPSYELPSKEFFPDVPQMIVNTGWRIRIDAIPKDFLFTTFIPNKNKSDGYHKKHTVGRFNAESINKGLLCYHNSHLQKETLDVVIRGLKNPAVRNDERVPLDANDMILQLSRLGTNNIPLDATSMVLQLYHIGANNDDMLQALYNGLQQEEFKKRKSSRRGKND